MCIPTDSMRLAGLFSMPPRQRKPRLIFANGRWLCAFPDVQNPRPYRGILVLMFPQGTGATPLAAFEDWKRRLQS